VVPSSSSSPLPSLSARRSLEQSRYWESSRQPAARSASTRLLPSRRKLHGPFQRNLPALAGSGSSGLINLLVVYPAASAVSRRPSLQTQGPQRADNKAPGPNSFLLRPTGFHHCGPQGAIGLTFRDCTAESALFVSDLRVVDFLLFFAAIARLPATLTTHGNSAIQRPNVSAPAKATSDRNPRTYAPGRASRSPSRSRSGVGFFNAR
jgi:hypothetical protein